MELTREDLEDFLNLASRFKKERYSKALDNKVLVMIFEKPSTRTRVSFEVAMMELGGKSITLNVNDIQLSRGESIEDTARTLELYSHVIGARVFNHQDIVRLARATRIPVINLLSDLYHPCQIVGDLLTIKELKGLNNITLAWVGDGNNVCNSLIIGCSLLGIRVNLAIPEGYEPYKEALEFAKDYVKIMRDPREAVKDVDIVYTDSFVPMGKEHEREVRLKKLFPKYQVNKELFSLAKDDAIFMHCLPAKRGEEVTDDVIDGERSVVWRQAENRLHAQKAILYRLLKGKD